MTRYPWKWRGINVANVSRSHLLAGSAAALALGPQIVRAQTVETLHLAGVPTDDMTPIFYALKTGLYQNAGLDLEFVRVSSGSTATTAIVERDLRDREGEPDRTDPRAPARAADPADRQRYRLDAAHAVQRDARRGRLADPDRRRLQRQDGRLAGLSDINSLAMSTWVDRNGGDSKTIKWVEVPGSAAAEAVAEHRVDFALINEPQLGLAALGRTGARARRRLRGGLAIVGSPHRTSPSPNGRRSTPTRSRSSCGLPMNRPRTRTRTRPRRRR